VTELLRDRSRRERIEDLASKTAARYDWSVVTEQFERVLIDTVGASGSTQSIDMQVVPMRA
jgi:hypothetical protein